MRLPDWLVGHEEAAARKTGMVANLVADTAALGTLLSATRDALTDGDVSRAVTLQAQASRRQAGLGEQMTSAKSRFPRLSLAYNRWQRLTARPVQ